MLYQMAIDIAKVLDIDLSGIPKENKEEAKEQIKEYLVDTILDYVSKGQSPVSGGKWKELSPSYKKEKSKISGSSKANMELYGDMLDDLYAEFKGSKLKVGFFGDNASEESKLKAENHNKFTKRSKKKVAKGSPSGRGGQLKVPERNFIPRKGQNFKRDIMQDIGAIIDEYRDASQD